MEAEAIRVVNVIKRQGSRETVCGVSLSVSAGERVALLGHNGAGKTTLIRMILGLTKVDSGSISVCGHAPGSPKARAISAYLPESVAFHKALSGREQLRLFARLAGQPVSKVDALLEKVGLSDAADRKIGTWSKGMRQRLGLAQVMIGQPKVALLDEPTSGLDPISRQEFYEIVDDMAKAGTAVLVSSHALTELEARTDRIAILRKGCLVASDSLANLRRQAHLPIRLKVTTPGNEADKVAAQLGGQRVNCKGVEIVCDQTEKMGRLGAITALGGLVDDVEVIPPSLEDLYRFYEAKGAKQ